MNKLPNKLRYGLLSAAIALAAAGPATNRARAVVVKKRVMGAVAPAVNLIGSRRSARQAQRLTDTRL